MGHFSALGADVGTADLGGGPLLDVPLCTGGRSWRVNCVAVGNPHCVVFVGDTPPEGADLALYGRELEHHPAFPGGINVEFARQISPTAFAVTVWERGSGATLSCGTGAWRRGGLRCADRPQRTRRADFGADARRHTGSTHPEG